MERDTYGKIEQLHWEGAWYLRQFQPNVVYDPTWLASLMRFSLPDQIQPPPSASTYVVHAGKTLKRRCVRNFCRQLLAENTTPNAPRKKTKFHLASTKVEGKIQGRTSTKSSILLRTRSIYCGEPCNHQLAHFSHCPWNFRALVCGKSRLQCDHFLCWLLLNAPFHAITRDHSTKRSKTWR